MIHSMSAAGRTSRKGFTLVELLVMSAVCVIIMAVLASVFGTGLDAIRHVRAQGDMMDQTRAASEVMKRDLRAEHFISDPIANGVGERTRLSEYRFNAVPPDPTPRGGFLVLYSPAGSAFNNEGTDSDGLISYRANDHHLHFTSIVSGNSDSNHYSATMLNASGQPIGTVTSPAAEIAYFLVQDPGRVTGGNGTYQPQQTYLLLRRQKLLAVNDVERARIQASVAGDPRADEVLSLSGGNVNRLTDVVSNNRMALTQLGGYRFGDDVLLSNVLSFEVKTITNTPAPFVAGGDTDHPYAYFGGKFDTGGTGGVGAPPQPSARVRSLQIRLRVYDSKMMQARQLTFVVDM